jgi:hypothetical protein
MVGADNLARSDGELAGKGKHLRLWPEHTSGEDRLIYPNEAGYKGGGSIDAVENFTCSAPGS